MSESAESLSGEAGQPLDHLSEDINDEIADHLALSAAEMARRSGCTGEEARRAAGVKFGNVTLVHWKCWWVKQGDFVMRRAAIVVIVVLAVGFLVAGIALPTLASLRSMRDNVDKLTEQFTALTKAQQELVEKQAAAQAPLELRGKCFLNTEDQPAVGVHVQIWNADEEKPVRNVWTDDAGEFRSGPLNPGPFFTVARLVGRGNPDMGYNVQSKLEYLTPGATPEQIKFDLYFPKGDIGFQLEQPVEATMKLGDKQTEYRLSIIAGIQQDQLRRVPANPLTTRVQAKTWPLLGSSRVITDWELTDADLVKREPFWIGSQENLDRWKDGPQNLLIAIHYDCAALLTVLPKSSPPTKTRQRGRSFERLFGENRDGVYWSRGFKVDVPLKLLPIDLADKTLQTVRIKLPDTEGLINLANEKPDGFTLPLDLELGSSEPLRN